MVKPGIRTSELVFTVLVAVGALAAALAQELPPRYAALAAAVSSGAYALSRGLAKRPVTPVASPPPAPAPPPVAAGKSGSTNTGTL